MSSIYSLENAEGLDESLAIVQQVNQEDEANKTGDYDQLHDAEDKLIEEDKKATEEENGDASNAEVNSDSDSSSDLDQDTSLDSPESDTEASSGDEDNLVDLSDKKQTPVTESLRNEHYERIVLESIEFSDIVNAGSSIYNAARSTAIGTSRLVAMLSVSLFALGVQYSPGIFRVVKKAVLYLFSRSVKVFFKSLIGLNDFIKQHRNSVSKRLEDIKSLREEIAKLKTSAETGELKLTIQGSSDKNLISWMTVSGKTDPMLSVAVMDKFISEIVEQVDKGFSNDIDAVNRLIAMTQHGASSGMLNYMRVAPFSGSFMRKSVNADEEKLVDGFVYSTVLPDQVLFVTELPKAGLKDIEAISQAYRESSVFLTTDNKHPPAVETVDYMELAKVGQFLDALESICHKAIAHIDGYRQTVKACEGLKLGYRQYYQKLISDERGKSVQDTLVEYIYLKQSFASKVYLPAAMDIRDYTASYLLRGIRLVKENIKAFKVDESNKESPV